MNHRFRNKRNIHLGTDALASAELHMPALGEDESSLPK